MRLIDADELKDRVGYIEEEYGHIMEEINNAPTVSPDMAQVLAYECGKAERNRGRWEMKPDPYGFFDEIPVCSECGCTTKMRETYKFCPNCGADMRGENNG